MIKSPTQHIQSAPNTSIFIDHVLTNTNEKITQCGLIKIELTNHQMIFCTRKVKKRKHKCPKTKRLWAKLYLQTMRDIIIQASHTTIFFQKLIEVVNNSALLKTARIKNTSNECFNIETAEKLSIKDKLFKTWNEVVST